MRHQRSVLRSPVMPWWLKAYWSILLTWRELFPIIAVQVVTLILCDLVLTGRLGLQFDPLVAVSATLTVVSGGVAAIATWRRSTPATREAQGVVRYAAFGLFSVAYTWLRNTVALVALAREALGDDRWVVTARAAAPAALLACMVLAAGSAPQARAATPAARETIDLVPTGGAPRDLTVRTPDARIPVDLPGTWSSVRGRLVLRLAGARQLTTGSRIEVLVDGRRVLAEPLRAGERTLVAEVGRTPVRGRRLEVLVRSTFTTRQSSCPAPDDPAASVQLLPGSRLELRPRRRPASRLSELPGALVAARGEEPAPVDVRFLGPPTPWGIGAAGEAAGAIAAARGYPGAHVRLVDGRTRPTLLIDDRPGAARLRVSERRQVATLTIAGTGPALLDAARRLTTGELRDESRAGRRLDGQAPGPTRTDPGTRLPLPAASGTGRGTAVASTGFRVDGRTQVARGARLRLDAQVQSPVATVVTVRVNGRIVAERRAGGPHPAGFRVDTVLADRGSTALRGDLLPGDNAVTVTAEVEPTTDCGSRRDVDVAIRPAGSIEIRPSARPVAAATLATWPFPLDRVVGWRGVEVILPAEPTRAELGAVIGVLAEARRLTGEPAMPAIRFGGSPSTGRPTLILARPDQIPAGVPAIRGGLGRGTLALGGPADAPVVVAVGARALQPLTRAFAPAELDARVVDVRRDAVTPRGPTGTVLTATTPPAGSIRWPLSIAGVALMVGFALLLRARHRATRRARDDAAGRGSGAA